MEIKTVVIEFEDYFGNTLGVVELDITNPNHIKVLRTKDCSHADTDADYHFNTDADLIRIQTDNN